MKNFLKKIIFSTIIGFLLFATQTVFAVESINLTVLPYLNGASIKGGVSGVTNLKDWEIKLEYSKDSKLSYTPIETIPYQKLDSTGLFEGKIKTLTPGETYYIRASISIPPRKSVIKEVSYKHFDYLSREVGVVAKNNSLDKEYKLLAPFAGLKIINTPADCAEIIKNNPNKPVVCDINTLISFIFRTLVGLTAVFMVIRLMLIGYNYMLTDTPFQKSKAKEDFLATLSGLVLALSAWLILNTINPKLLENNFAVETVSVSGFSTEEPMLTQDIVTVPTGQLTGCGVGADNAVTVSGTFVVCKTYIPEFVAMVKKAKDAGYTLTGGAYRSTARQTELRRRNCHGNITGKYPKPPCSPPTAVPGTSNHERGLAVDFSCNGKLINWVSDVNAVGYQPARTISPETKKCFEWLKANSGNMTNLQSENWHWEYPPSN